jgi:hypothetical protein
MSSKNPDYKRQKSSPYKGVTWGDENYLFVYLGPITQPKTFSGKPYNQKKTLT